MEIGKFLLYVQVCGLDVFVSLTCPEWLSGHTLAAP